MENTISKKDLIKDIQESVLQEGVKMSIDTLSFFYDKTVETIKTAIINGQSVRIKGFCSFYPVKKEPATARNPKTGEAVEVGERIAVRAKFSRSFKDEVNV